MISYCLKLHKSRMTKGAVVDRQSLEGFEAKGVS